MKKIKKKISMNRMMVLLMLFSFASCGKKAPSDLTGECIIPAPVTVAATGKYFTIKKGTHIYLNSESEELRQTGEYLAERLRPATGFEIEVRQATRKPKRGSICLSLTGNSENPADESYELNIEEKTLNLSAASPAGVFRGVQTIRQLLPPKIENKTLQEGPWEIPTGTIRDHPDYAYRGVMLDVSRHFFGIDDVKRLIDLISYYKINTLHLHLSDDQGWRIEIKSWPNLTVHGGSTQVGGGPGGYYTQEQYTDIVNYAQKHYITIIPEIDMPGHTNAALASYPELNCDNRARDLYTGKKVGFSTLCIKKEITFKFVEDVVRELSALTPGPYFHIGGDESYATKYEDYITFIERVQDIVKSYGKRVIGWDEIATARLTDGSVAQYWDNPENAALALKQGQKVLFSPAKMAYLDMKYDSTIKLGLNWAGYTEVDKAYNWDPVDLVPGIRKEDILGVEAPLWSETVTNMDEIEFMVFPRLAGIAEIGWTPAIKRDWIEYRERLASHGERFKLMDVNFYQSKLIPWEESKKPE